MKSKVVTVIAMMGLVVALTGVSIAGAQSGEDPAQVAAGEAIYSANCAGCHGADGTGSNSGRPLTGIAAQEPDRTVHLASVANGKGGMPAFGDGLSDDEIDAAVAYVRATFVAADSQPLAETGAESRQLAGIGLALMAVGAAAIGGQAITRRRAI